VKIPVSFPHELLLISVAIIILNAFSVFFAGLCWKLWSLSPYLVSVWTLNQLSVISAA
jgi:hypothetical protein